jgi:hypothetical protein
MFKFDKNNIKHWAEKYADSYASQDNSAEDRLKNIFKSQRYLTQTNLYDILNWKSPRIRNYAKKNAPKKIRKITRNSFSTKDERNRIESLLGQKGGLKGVGYPVASTILHFAFPNKYPIMAFRVIRALKTLYPIFKNWTDGQPSSYNFVFWENYYKTIRSLSRERGCSIRELEKAFWKFDKEQNSRKNNCQ